MKFVLQIWLVAFLGAVAFAGTNTIISVPSSPQQYVRTNHVNQYYSALSGDLVPRNSSGIATDLGGDLGQSTKRWDDLFSKKLNIGAAGSGLFIDDNGGLLRFGVGGVAVADVSSTGRWVASLGQQVGSSTGTYSTSSTSYTAVTNVSATITTRGRPVFLTLISADGDPLASNACSIGATTTGGGSYAIEYVWKRGSTGIGHYVQSFDPNVSSRTLFIPCTSVLHFDVVAAGTYTYTLEVKTNGATTNITHAKIFAYELGG